ncbi:hypothetical protein QBC38DRAFT_465964 [Podospora fimiseda]|uniref:DUF1749-domain-containing protein n=1 Tax=Podospora fimiseda TaxID=252190 RepID=A0AAN7BXL5_9PEZI|nr:hypothetical protein QBC38DRAFT_465964 [Podospora fimiseda]
MSSKPSLNPLSTLVHFLPNPSSPSSQLLLFQYLPQPFTPYPSPNALIFLPGLGDTPLTLPYIHDLAKSFPLLSPSYTLFEPRLSSSGSAFGYSSLKQDALEINSCIKYLRETVGLKKVVLMGHSTGCQDSLEYLLSYGDVEGVILQGPVSDREAIYMSCEEDEIKRSWEEAKKMIKDGKKDEIMQKENLPAVWRGSPMSAGRWWALSGVGGEDDYFSSDLTDERLTEIWGGIKEGVKILILPSEKDEWVAVFINAEELIKKWKGFCKPGVEVSELSGLIPGANHRVDNTKEGEWWLIERVIKFLKEEV